MEDFAGHPDALVGDVDCTAEGKPLCDENDVKGFPTLMWGEPGSLEKYEGGRSYDELKEHASENLGPQCSPAHIELCNDEKTAAINALMSMPMEDLATKVVGGKGKIKRAEAKLEKKQKRIQTRWEAAQKERDDAVNGVMATGLGLQKSVLAHRRMLRAEGKEEL